MRYEWTCECGMEWATYGDEHTKSVGRCPRCGSDQLAVDPPISVGESNKSAVPGRGPGESRLWKWFGLSYASFLTLPRVLMHEMPDRWQREMADLLQQYSDTWKGIEGIRATVRFRGDDGRYVSAPDWLANYRHPDRDEIERVRRKSDAAA